MPEKMTPKKVRLDPSLTPEENAARMLPPLVSAYFEAGRKVASEPAEPTDLHRFRLEGKRLRYAMELFAPCYGRAFDRYLDLLRKAQTWLGDFNDCDATARLLDDMIIATRQRRKALTFLKRQSVELYDGFQKFWKHDVDATGVEKRWTTYMLHPRPRKT